jgi:aminoglycoside phosphotransferase (APT) family kinase protein
VLPRRADAAEIGIKLIPWLQKKMPQARTLALSNIRGAERGFSNDTCLFDLSWEETGRHRSVGMVLRRPPKLPLFPESSLQLQFRVMQSLWGTNVPVPKVYWLETDDSVLGDPFYIMGEIKGVSPSDFPAYHASGVYFDATPEQRATMWWGCVEAIAKIHALDWSTLGLSFLGDPAHPGGPIDWLLDLYERRLDWAKQGPQPILETALRWLRKNVYIPEHVVLCWGDSRMSNIIYTPDLAVAALLDWEIAYLGDHEADLAWMLFLDWASSEGGGIPRLPGTPSREESVHRYEELTGWKVTNLFYNEVLAAVELAVPMLTVFKNLRAAGMPLGEDVERNNFCTQRLSELLRLSDSCA